MRSIILCILPVVFVHGVRRTPSDAIRLSRGRRLEFQVSHDHDDHDDDDDEGASPPQPSSRRESATTNNANTNDPNPDAHLVTSMPLLPDGVFPTRHWAGHLPASNDGSDKKLFYWLFEPGGDDLANIPNEEEIPLMLWLNGGPGCSSMDGLWLENGPFRLKKVDDDNGWTIDVNKYSWHMAPAWTLYVDQPVGTGLSFSRKRTWCKNDFEVNRDFHYFLEEFFLFHRDKFLTALVDTNRNDNNMSATWTLKRPFYFTGESHAGHYIPSMMDYILQRNDGNIVPSETYGLQPLRVIIPCSGAAIGNGWIDPYHQYSASDAAYGAGLIGTAERASFEEEERVCQSNLKAGVLNSNICFDLLDEIIDQSSGINGNSQVSIYDTRLWESREGTRTFPPGHKDVESYLGGARSQSHPQLKVNYHDVLVAIHATEASAAGQTYQECTDPPYLALSHQDGLGVTNEIVRILDHESKPHMLFFNGMNDLICNHVGNEHLLDVLPWSKTSEYKKQPRYAWESGIDASEKENYSPGRPDGYIKQFENLSFLKILEAGHMVPMDQPAIALAMIKTLLFGTRRSNSNAFFSSLQDLHVADPEIGTNLCKLDSCPNCPPITGEQSFSGKPSIGMTSITFYNVGILLSVFLSGIICAYICQRYQRKVAARRVLVSLEDDMELTDQDSIYHDSPNENGFT